MLHDERIPALARTSTTSSSHQAAFWVIHAKDYKGKVERRSVGPFWRPELKVFVGGGDRTKLVRGVAGQVEATRAALTPGPLAADVVIKPAVCFVASDSGFFPRAFELDGVFVTYPESSRSASRHRAAHGHC